MSKIPFFKFFTNSKFSVSNENKYYVGVKPQPTLSCVGRIEKRLIKNSLCHPELAAPLVADEKEAYKGGCSQSISGSYRHQECSTTCTQKSNVGLKAQPTSTAFTLAEVLITLGIIGVVAAMTLPTLTANYRKKEVVTKLKRVYTIMNQAILMSSAQNGEPKYWVKDCGASTASTCSTDEVEVWFKQYLGKYLQILKIEKGTTKADSVPLLYVYLNDGSILGIRNYIYDMVFYTDKKAIDNPQSGRNYFNFRFNPSLVGGQDMEDNRFAKMGTFEPQTFRWDGTREDLLRQGDDYGCTEQGGAFCAKLIQFDGWEIKDDYPVRF